MTVIGPPVDPRVHEIRTFLNRNRISFDTIDTTDPLQAAAAGAHAAFPVVVLADGELLFAGTPRELEQAVGATGLDFEEAFVAFLRQRGH